MSDKTSDLKQKHKPMHGTAKAKGCSHLQLGNFCKMFPELHSWGDEYGIEDQCKAENIAAALGGINSIMHDINSDSPDSSIPAAYTFLAQFIDHDLTLDTTSNLHGEPLDNAEVSHLPNLRSASLDLDNIYGFGPDASPFLYDQSQPGRMLIGNENNQNDVPRNSDGRALIGDPRNDENIFLSQMQLLFLRFHNRRIIGRSFEEAQIDVRYHYQYIVLKDFLKRICDENVYNYALSELGSGHFPKCDIRDKCGRICMPVEFSVAAYRFGHSLVRSQYPTNSNYPVIDLFDERFGTEGFGFVPSELTVDWRFLLDVESCHDYVKSKAFDHLLADELIRMPDPIVGRFASDNDRSLAFRNLLRGYALGLPSGQSVAAALADKGYPVNELQSLQFSNMYGWNCLDSDTRCSLERHTPLFLYIMRESGVVNEGRRLGPVGSAILMEVFGAILVYCDSFLNKDWEPDPCIVGDGTLTLADIVRYVNK